MKKISLLSLLTLSCIFANATIQSVTVQNHVFIPSSFTINLGDTIRWIWVSGTHTTTSVTIPAGAATWNKNINSTTTTFLYVPAVAGAYNYKCTPHATMGMVASFTVVCPAVTSHINATGNTTICNGSSVVFHSTVTGATIFQWKKNGNIINGANGASYTATTSGSYNLAASNSCGSIKTSNSISVTVNPLPNATITPSDTVYICPGDSVKLQANTSASLAYQWIKGGVAINGATTSSYYAKQTGNYKVRVTKTTTGCTRTSALTRVIVNCKEGTVSGNEKNIRIYPSPASDQFNLEIIGFNNEHYITRVFDENGKMVTTFNISGALTTFGSELADGIYFIEILNGESLVDRLKVVKMK